jgi:nucleotide-binding universal stress UspA family protein
MTNSADGPLLLCYDGSEDAKHAIKRAGALLRGTPALVLTVWQPTHALGSFAWAGASAGMVDFLELDRAAAEDAGNVAHDGVRIAQAAALKAEPVAVEAAGPVWKTIVEIADQHDAATIRHGFARTDRLALNAAGKRLQRGRSSRRPPHAHHPSPQGGILTRTDLGQHVAGLEMLLQPCGRPPPWWARLRNGQKATGFHRKDHEG